VRSATVTAARKSPVLFMPVETLRGACGSTGVAEPQPKRH
jgi:hypothetical protein